MRQVFDPSTVAHYWANQRQESAHNSGNNFYYEGKTIYSYGSHFPIAVLHSKNGERTHVIFTTRSYSNITAKHINEARSASSHYPTILCAYPEKAVRNQHIDNINQFEHAAKLAAQKLPNAVKPAKYLTEIAEQKELLNKYVQYFNVGKNLYKHLHYINIVTKDGAIKATEAEQKQTEKERKAKEKRREEQRVKNIAKIKNYY